MRLTLDLREPDASDPALTGAKAANLACCAASGLPVLPGFALTTGAAARGLDDPQVIEALRQGYDELRSRAGGDIAVVARSSSTIEDAGTSSMAGQFTSILDIDGWDALLVAVRDVLASADAVRDREGEARPMAVLVQAQLDSPLGGVLFGIDPVTGNRAHLVVEAVPSRPDTLVGGTVTAAHFVLSRRGRLLEHTRDTAATTLGRPLRRRLAGLARRGASTFGGPQDMEWAVDRQGRLWLLQSRPVTAVAAHAGRGHVFGPGPVAETFPAPLHRLEADLFARPLREGIVNALRVTGAATEHQLSSSPVLSLVGDHVAVDLELLGITKGHRSLRSRASPAAIVRRLASAWRVGRIRVALPTLAAQMTATIDTHLEAQPPLGGLSTSELHELVQACPAELAAAHTYEILAGMLLGDEPAVVSAAAVGLQALAAGRADDLGDADLVAARPEVLALVPPAIAPLGPLPDAGVVAGARPGGVDVLGTRLQASGRVTDPLLVRELTLAELATAVTGGPVPEDLVARAAAPPGPPLPDAFRLGAAGDVLPARHRRASTTAGIAAGGGRGTGVARHRLPAGRVDPGVVLVTRHLEPQLAATLPGLAGLVSETGSALSHLAILAREMQVPTVVGVTGALTRFPPGSRLLVDGTTGEVQVIEELGLDQGDGHGPATAARGDAA